MVTKPYTNNIYYRISVENDFTNVAATLDYKELGQGHLISSDFFIVSGNKPVRNSINSGIHIKLNFKEICFTKEKATAKSVLTNLIDNAPSDARHYILEFTDDFWRALNI